MSRIPAAVPLSELTIPGTHQSCARRGGLPMRILQCQNSTFDVAAQLTTGIRYLDIRCCAHRDTLRLHHDFVFQQHNLDGVLRQCAEFLSSHSSETIIMRIRQEHSTVTAERFCRLFVEHITKAGLAGRLWLAPDIPLLGQAAGKVVVVSGSPYVGGIAWNDNPVMEVQDDWTVSSRAVKLQRVLAGLDRAMHRRQQPDGGARRLFIHHASGYRAPWHTPRAMAKYINPRLTQAVRALRDRPTRGSGQVGLGILAMDFADEAAELVDMLIAWNLGLKKDNAGTSG